MVDFASEFRSYAGVNSFSFHTDGICPTSADICQCVFLLRFSHVWRDSEKIRKNPLTFDSECQTNTVMKLTHKVEARVSKATARRVRIAAQVRGEKPAMILREALAEYFQRRESQPMKQAA